MTFFVNCRVTEEVKKATEHINIQKKIYSKALNFIFSCKIGFTYTLVGVNIFLKKMQKNGSLETFFVQIYENTE